MMRLVSLLLCALLAVSGSSAGVLPADSLKALDSYVRQALRDWDVPGAAIALVQEDGVVFERGFGLRRLGRPDPVDPHTLFAIASLSKAFTAAAIGMLVDQGTLAWDDKVADRLPGFQMYDPYVTREMTIRDLLCHRSGLHTFAGDLIWYGTSYSPEEVLRRIRYLAPRYGFRAQYGYQNIMVLAAGMIAERAVHRSWDQIVRDSIFARLGMTESRTSVKELAGEDNVATPHVDREGKNIIVPYRGLENIAPAAAINASVHDLVRWLMMWVRDSTSTVPRLLSDAARSEMLQMHMPIRQSPRARRLTPGRHLYGAALGWFVMDYKGRLVATHGGGMDGMTSQICIIPEERTGFVILTNSTTGLSGALLYRMLDMILGGPAKDWSREALRLTREARMRAHVQEAEQEGRRARDSHPSLALDAYAGTYRSEMYGDVVVSREKETLVARFVPTASFVGDLTHWQYDTFRIVLRDPTLPPGLATFVLNARGEPAELKIDIPNPDFDFTELKLLRAGGTGK